VRPAPAQPGGAEPQRKLEERRGAGVAEKRALDFAAARACCLCDYQQTNVGFAASLRPHQIALAASSTWISPAA